MKGCAHCEEEEHGIKLSMMLNPLYFFIIVLIIGVVLGIYFEKLALFGDQILSFVNIIWFPVLLGLIIGAIINYFVPNEYVSHYLAGPGMKPIIFAVILGFLFDACSHGILIIGLTLYRKGASIPAVIAFLLSSPWNSFSITFLLLSFFGLKGLLFLILSMVIALFSGFIFSKIEGKWIEKSAFVVKTKKAFSLWKDAKIRVKKWRRKRKKIDWKKFFTDGWNLAQPIILWISVGVLLSAIVGAYVGDQTISEYFGPTLIGMAATLFLAAVLEICSEGSAILAFKLYDATKAFGNTFIFMMAGVVSDYTEIGSISSIIGWRTAIALPLITIPQVLIVGYFLNFL